MFPCMSPKTANFMDKLPGDQQHPPVLVLLSHPQVGSPPVIMLLIMAAAQPTPLSTLNAPKAQLDAQAPHSMHLSLSMMTAFLSRSTNTLCGQTSRHMPHPVHFSVSRPTLATSAKYFIAHPTG